MVSSAVANHASFKNNKSYSALEAQVRIVDNARPFGVSLKERRSLDSKRQSRTKKGCTPNWLVEAMVLLRQSDGSMTDTAIAAEVGKHPANFSRNKAWKEERKKYDRSLDEPKKRPDLGPSKEKFAGAYHTSDDPDEDEANEDFR